MLEIMLDQLSAYHLCSIWLINIIKIKTKQPKKEISMKWDSHRHFISTTELISLLILPNLIVTRILFSIVVRLMGGFDMLK